MEIKSRIWLFIIWKLRQSLKRVNPWIQFASYIIYVCENAPHVLQTIICSEVMDHQCEYVLFIRVCWIHTNGLFWFPRSVMLIGVLNVLGVFWQRVAQMNCQSDDTQQSCPEDYQVHGMGARHGVGCFWNVCNGIDEHYYNMLTG